ncbi:uncharacterized protein LOC119734634 [Patiria miniata]|uniref:Uncharacterized protein n=1 Tax=Patiria miniata TaxID=46514 RepID=A0A914AKH9_PATMI|nr:uncharacterized protein LOC119734634 [Patiria miniata]
MAVSGAAGARAAMLHVPRNRRRSSTASYADSSGHGTPRTPSIAPAEGLEYDNRNGRPPDLEGEGNEKISDIYMSRRYGAEVNAKDTLIAVEQWKRNQTDSDKLSKAQKKRREYE